MSKLEKSIIADLMESSSPEFRSKIIDVMNRAGYNQDDPLFVLLLANKQLELMLYQTPQALEKIFDNWLIEMRSCHELAERELINRQKAAINESLAQLLKNKHNIQGDSGAAIDWNKLFSASILTFASIFTLGVICGYFLKAYTNFEPQNRVKQEVVTPTLAPTPNIIKPRKK